MDIDEQGQRFSCAYVRAVASVAGYAVQGTETDDDSVDLTISRKGGGGTLRSPKLDVQVKHRRSPHDGGDTISYPLKLKNYDELRGSDFQVPRVLVVVLVPADPSDWLDHSEDELALRHCGYWVSLRTKPQTDNTTSVTVPIPRAQTLTVAALRELMRVVGEGDAP